ncbi:MAG: circadian clock protein KaiC, partial [Verrucomicrobia bacterium]|nr:circadian clock protein KaiC [Verrucomicrobiota bacterium]
MKRNPKSKAESARPAKQIQNPKSLPKSPTGIRGLDEITGGGLPTGRPTLVCGSAGCGKTLLAMEFLVHGALDYGEPGVFMAFEETAPDLAKNVASLGFDLNTLIARKQLAIDYVHIERSEIEETGEYDLEGLFIRLEHAIKSIGAKRVVLDTVESLFAGLPNPAILRAELRRLFRWLKDKGLTAVITGERGEATLTRYGIEEYVSDCVLVLDHRVTDQLSTRRLRVVKYRGSLHGTNEYPFLIDERGISVLPVTSLGLKHTVTSERVSSGIARLDTMLGGKGYYRGSSVLVSGTAGSGKTSVAAHFADATCRRGERCLMFLFEESPSQIIRNMRSIGVNLEPWVKKGLLQFHAARPALYGLEMHLATTIKAVNEFNPSVVVVDPISSFTATGSEPEIKAMLIRLVDFLKVKGVTTLLVNLTSGGGAMERTDAEISSLIDTWLLLRDIELNGERNRGMYILKSRGMAHSNQIREFILTSRGVELADVYVGAGGVLTGSARQAQEAAETAAKLTAKQEVERQQRVLQRKREAMESQIAALRAEFAAEEVEADRVISEGQRRAAQLTLDREAMGRSRHADGTAPER